MTKRIVLGVALVGALLLTSCAPAGPSPEERAREAIQAVLSVGELAAPADLVDAIVADATRLCGDETGSAGWVSGAGSSAVGDAFTTAQGIVCS